MVIKLNFVCTTTLSAFALTTVLGLSSSPAQAFSFTVNNTSGTWSNFVGGTDITQNTVGSENQVRWGKVPDDSLIQALPEYMRTGEQSGLGFKGADQQTLRLGEPFLLGTFSHFNNAVLSGTSIDSSDLTIGLDLTVHPDSSKSQNRSESFTFSLRIEETANAKNTGNSIELIDARSGTEFWEPGENCKYQGITSCPDRVFPVGTLPDEVFELDGKRYTLEWVGFSNAFDRPLIIPGITEEGNLNQADIYVFGKLVDVENPTPVFKIGVNNPIIKQGDLFNFSVADDNAEDNDLVRFEWDLDNDGIYDDFLGAKGQWSFTETGVHPVKLRIATGDGQFDFDSFDVIVENVAPTITSLTENLTVFENELFSFGAAATDPGINDLLSFGWDLNNDGIYDDLIGENQEWFFDKYGIYTIGLEVNDGNGGVALGSFNVTVNKVPEPSSTLSLLAIGAVSAFGFLKRKK